MGMKEETCIVLDFLLNGYPDQRHAEPIAQVIGTSHFSLLEIVPREDASPKEEDEFYIGEGKRDHVKFIKGMLEYRSLTNQAKSILPAVVEALVKKNEQQFVEFFNKGRMITPRMHQFQLLHGVGKKHLLDILEERRKRPFESFADIATRVKMFPDIVKTLSKRVLQELEGNEKYYLFTPMPRRQNER